MREWMFWVLLTSITCVGIGQALLAVNMERRIEDVKCCACQWLCIEDE